jgi:hypothetical protein
MITLSPPTTRSPGRFQGFERVDIIRWLHTMGLGHVLRRVFEHLSAVDLSSAAEVCVRWHVAVVQDALAERKMKNLISSRKQNLVSTGSGTGVLYVSRPFSRLFSVQSKNVIR